MDKSAAELSQYRYEQAKQCIKSANVLVETEVSESFLSKKFELDEGENDELISYNSKL